MSRITKDDVANSVHRLHDQHENVAAKDETLTENEYYTFFGKHNYLDDYGYPRLVDEETPSLVHAKKLWVRTAFKYYVREQNGKPYNPNPVVPPARNDKNKNNPNTYMQVSPAVFKMYIDFLRTKNTAHLNNANRNL